MEGCLKLIGLAVTRNFIVTQQLQMGERGLFCFALRASTDEYGCHVKEMLFNYLTYFTFSEPFIVIHEREKYQQMHNLF